MLSVRVEFVFSFFYFIILRFFFFFLKSFLFGGERANGIFIRLESGKNFHGELINIIYISLSNERILSFFEQFCYFTLFMQINDHEAGRGGGAGA
jgi:hypothetical protein